MSATPIDVLFDTNALFMSREDKKLLLEATRRGKVRVHIPALVLVERERQLIQCDHVRSASGQEVSIDNSVRRFRQLIDQLVFDLSGRPFQRPRTDRMDCDVIGQLAYDDPVIVFDRYQAECVSAAWGEWLASLPKPDLLTELSADEAAEELRQRFRRRWKKKERRLPDVDWAIHKADWSIAAVARTTGWPIVTNDRGDPFKQQGVRTMRYEDFVAEYLTG